MLKPPTSCAIAQIDKDFQEVTFKDANRVYRKSMESVDLDPVLEERGADQLVACEESEA